MPGQTLLPTRRATRSGPSSWLLRLLAAAFLVLLLPTTALTEAAWAAGRCKQGYLAAQFRRLAARRGKKRAVVAVAHSLIVIVYHMLRDGTEYQDLGTSYFDERDRTAIQHRAVGRLEALGFRVHLEPLAQPVTSPATIPEVA